MLANSSLNRFTNSTIAVVSMFQKLKKKLLWQICVSVQSQYKIIICRCFACSRQCEAFDGIWAWRGLHQIQYNLLCCAMSNCNSRAKLIASSAPRLNMSMIWLCKQKQSQCLLRKPIGCITTVRNALSNATTERLFAAEGMRICPSDIRFWENPALDGCARISGRWHRNA